MKKTMEQKRIKAVKSKLIIFPRECSCCQGTVSFEKMWHVKRWGVNKMVYDNYYCKECMPTAEDVVHSIDTDNCMFGIAFVDPHTLDKEIERRHLTPPIMPLEENVGSIC